MNNSRIYERPERDLASLSLAGPASNVTQPPPSPEYRALAEDENKTLEDEKLKEEAVTWRSLPQKRQLAVLTMARLSEPLVQTSLQVTLRTAIVVIIVSDS